MRSVNRVTLIGQVQGDPQRRAAGQKPICNFTLETVEEWVDQTGGQRRACLHDCVAFGPVAKALSSVREGDYVYVEGALRPDRNNGEGYAHEVVCFVAIPVADPEDAQSESERLGDDGQVSAFK